MLLQPNVSAQCQISHTLKWPFYPPKLSFLLPLTAQIPILTGFPVALLVLAGHFEALPTLPPPPHSSPGVVVDPLLMQLNRGEINLNQ